MSDPPTPTCAPGALTRCRPSATPSTRSSAAASPARASATADARAQDWFDLGHLDPDAPGKFPGIGARRRRRCRSGRVSGVRPVEGTADRSAARVPPPPTDATEPAPTATAAAAPEPEPPSRKIARGAAGRARRADRADRRQGRDPPPGRGAAGRGPAHEGRAAVGHHHPAPRLRRQPRHRQDHRGPAGRRHLPGPRAAARKGQLVEVDRSELVAGYLGQTAIKTAEVVASAAGGVLFIDEAYSLAGDQYGTEAVDTLVKEMEDRRDDLVLIVAGYPDPMVVFIAQNPGLASRFRTTIEFADYTDDELLSIFQRLADGADYDVAGGCLDPLPRPCWRPPRAGRSFGNGRFARNLLEAAIGRHAWRLRDVTEPTVEQLRELLPEDLDDEPADRRPPDEPSEPPTGRPRRALSPSKGRTMRASQAQPADPTTAAPTLPAHRQRGPTVSQAQAQRRRRGTGAGATRRRDAGDGHAGPAGRRPGRGRAAARQATGHPAGSGCSPRRCWPASCSVWSAPWRFPLLAYALHRAESDTAQLIRVQQIQTNLLQRRRHRHQRVPGRRPGAARAAGRTTTALTATAPLIAEAAARSPADRRDAPGRAQPAGRRLRRHIEQARANNRQGCPVGAQYLRSGQRAAAGRRAADPGQPGQRQRRPGRGPDGRLDRDWSS